MGKKIGQQAAKQQRQPWGFGWLIGCILLLTVQPALASPSSHCFFLADGSTVALQLVSDEIVVETAEKATPGALEAAVRRHLGQTVRLSPRPLGRDGCLFLFDLATSFSTEAWRERAALLRADDAIHRIYPVFVHPPLGHHVVSTDEIVVCVRDGGNTGKMPVPPVEALSAHAGPFQLNVLERSRYDDRILRLRIENAEPFSALELSNALFRSGAVEWAEPNFVIEVRRAYMPNDPYFPLQWHLNNTGQTGGLPDADIDAAEAWDVTPGSPRVTIAILDDGLDLDHPDLRDNIFTNPGEIAGNGHDDDGNGFVDDVHGWDFYADDNNPQPDSAMDYHATPCAGMAAAVMDNTAGVASVAPGCKILPCRIMGEGDPTVYQLSQAIHYAGAMADVLSMSWTAPADSTIAASLQHAATSGRSGLGCLLCAATGNQSSSDAIGFPASLDNVMGIGASTFRDVRSAYSNYAPGYGVFLLAPSSEPGLTNGVYTLRPGGGYQWFTGTSACPPQVAGVCGLILSIAPSFSRLQVETILRDTADKIDPAGAAYDATGYSNAYGYGRLNADRAVILTAPDLAAIAFDFQPKAVAADGTLSFSGSVRNLGSGASAPCWLEFWLSRSPSYATLDILLNASVFLPALAPGAEFRLEPIAANLSFAVPDGLYRLGIVIDRQNEQIETDESNNTVYQEDSLLQVGAGSTNVDLTVEGFDFWPAWTAAAEPIALAGRIVNFGGQMSCEVWVEFWVSTDPAGGSLDHLLCDSAKIGPLGPAEAFDLSTLHRIVFGPAQGLANGRYRLGVVIDRQGAQVETNKNNNTLYRLDKWLIVGGATAAGAWHFYP